MRTILSSVPLLSGFVTLSAIACGGDVDPANPCHDLNRPPPPSVVSLDLEGVDLGGGDHDAGSSPSAWESIGSNVDGLCTTQTSTGVCTSPGEPRTPASDARRRDGVDGTDNAFGSNMIAFTLAESSTPVVQAARLVTDASGRGTLYLELAGNARTHPNPAPIRVTIPLSVARVSMSASGGGVLSGVIDTEPFIANVQQAWAEAALEDADLGLRATLCANPPSHDDGPFDLRSALDDVRSRQDILQDGSNAEGVACTGISIGLAFAASKPFSGELPQVPHACE